VFISVKNDDKRNLVFIAKKLFDLGFEIVATKGTDKVLRSNGIESEMVGKVGEGDDKILDLIKKDELKLIINTPSGPRGQSDMKPIRNMAVMHGVPCITTIQGAQAAVNGIESITKSGLQVKSVQEYLGRS
jgi:carbamoyl-phosphate synthase large subunit